MQMTGAAPIRLPDGRLVEVWWPKMEPAPPKAILAKWLTLAFPGAGNQDFRAL